MLEIKDLTPDLYDSFVSFIDENWRKGHIFTYNREIFDFQHLAEDSSYNFLVATIHNRIVGVFGYIPLNQYDKKIDSDNVWGAIWKVTDDAPVGLGLKMLKVAVKKYKTYGAVGLSQDAIKMYNALGYTNGTVNQYYILNPCIESYRIAKAQKPSLNYDLSEKSLFTYTDSLNHIEDVQGVYAPIKSVQYFVNRYQHHPIYNYKFLYIPGKLIIAYRVIEANGGKCIRIIDLLGDLSSVQSLYGSFLKLLVDENAEYVDCLNFGLDETVFSKHSFVKLDTECSDVIIPNYFEPFEQRNVVLFCAHNSEECNYTFFKGDADQDRPNVI